MPGSNLARAVTLKYYHITPVLKSIHWLKFQRVHCKIVSYLLLTMLFKPLNPLAFPNFKPSNHPGLFAHHHLSIFRPTVSSSQKFCNCSLVYAARSPWNGLPGDLHQIAQPPNPPLNFTSYPLALSSATFN